MNIVIEENPAYDCLDMLIAAIAKYDNKEYRLMFIDAWRFLYNDIEWDYLGDKMAQFSLKWAYLKKYHGMNVNVIKKNTHTEKVEFIKEQIKLEKPVIMKIDVFYCHWIIRSYKVRHSDHYCIVVGIDDENVYIIDSYGINKKITLPYEDFVAGSSIFLIFDYISNVEKVNWKHLLIKELKCIKRYDMINSILEFSKDVQKYFDANKEIQNTGNMNSSTTLHKIGQVLRNRRRFALSLSCLMERYDIDNLNFIIDKLLYVANIWGMVYGMMMKTSHIDDPSYYIGKITNKIEKIAGVEQGIIDDLYLIIDDKPIQPFNPYKKYEKCNISKYYYLNLTNDFNNNAIGYKENQKCYPDLTGDDRFIVINDEIKKGYLEIDNMRFTLPDYINGTCDNIECYSQVLDIAQTDGNSYDNIFILGCCDIGSHSDDIIINYKDGTKEIKELRLSSWLSEARRFNDILAWISQGAVIRGDMIKCYDFDIHLYANFIDVNPNKIIDTIELPYCPNIHLFAITLAKKSN
ncbi:hypothetical protein SH1V18_25470 [Vallitalea longa]|uniref:Butirosin biosynthesis protein H N-terminal domain-containing protein n=1 Tax=Vallitalea longa TaxID=2936439 RepID=A0A9W5YA02_9FIRM|nr:BtrH N-terminal domain-containing protein [Vallitalea longa]GKX30067.1 hypothetical protein SH1V18_25470 [Vallitalea longa]